MKTRKHSIHRLVFLFALPCAVALCLAPAARVQDSAKASVQVKGGLQVITFDIPFARVVVNLPDDMMAGDTISGTVVTEIKGQTNEERERNSKPISDATFTVSSNGNTTHAYSVKLVGDRPSPGPPFQLIATKITFTDPAAFQCALQVGSQNIVQANINTAPAFNVATGLLVPNG